LTQNTARTRIAKNGRGATSLPIDHTIPLDHTIPRRGEIWLVNFDPTIGAEIRKKRPAIVVSSDALGKLPIKLVAPVTGWKDSFSRSAWHLRIDPDSSNGLTKVSAADVLQLRGMDVQRFVMRLGHLHPNQLDDLAAAIAIVVEYVG
jgi:mRNA interferase MazF